MAQTSDQPSRTLPAWLTAERSFTLNLPQLREQLTWLAVAVGVLLRVIEYSENRVLYLDERLLLENLTNLPVWDLHTVLSNDQLAPPGFLVLERMMVRLPFPVVPSARFIPLLAALGTMLFFPKVARHYLDPRAVPLATTLFALGDYSIYYASEIKQYSVEVAMALWALGLAANVSEREGSGHRRRLIQLAVFGVVAVWFSFPLIFSLAGIGLVGMTTEVIRKNWRQTSLWVAIGAGWLVSFGGCFLVSDRIVTKGPFLRTWWDFAFLRIPPKNWIEASGVFWQFVNVIIDPTGVIGPVPHLWTGLLGSLLVLVGIVSMAKRWPAGEIIVAAPFVFAATAAALRQYPFHGRLIQFLIPTVLFFLAEGVAFLSRRGKLGWRLSLILSAFLLVQPADDAFSYRFLTNRSRPFDSHGDLHNDLLDELEKVFHRPMP